MMFFWNEFRMMSVPKAYLLFVVTFFRGRFKNIKRDRNVLNRIFSDSVIILEVQQNAEYPRTSKD